MSTSGTDHTELATATAIVNSADSFTEVNGPSTTNDTKAVGNEVSVTAAIISVTISSVAESLATNTVDASPSPPSDTPINQSANTIPWSILPLKTTIALLSGSAAFFLLLLVLSLALCVTRHHRRTKQRECRSTPASAVPQDSASEEYPLDAFIASYAAAVTPPRPRAAAAIQPPSPPMNKWSSVCARTSIYTTSHADTTSIPESGSLVSGAGNVNNYGDVEAVGVQSLDRVERKRGYMRRVGIESEEE
ncbi:hypothetical protein BC830DRAFT_1168802 [Chytriomyces sp. MP71]|nr:hypothetical protein BC830DRAFT_1168802 [Chytriomyces sp. MP71]